MSPSNRIIVNTAVQYARTLLSMLIMLFTTRYLLQILGESRFGTYSVVGSAVYVIGFITVSLASSTQRFLSFSQGLNDKQELRRIFANAFALHAVIALLIGVVMLLIEPLIMSYLVIPEDQQNASHFVYYMVLIMTLLTFIAAPVRALYIARENIVYVSVVEVVDALLKLLGTLSLPFIAYDSLKVYAIYMALISLFNLLAYALFALSKYDECHIPNSKEISQAYIRKLMGFSVWNIYAVGSGVVRTQGFAFLLNHFFGTLLNAAYGIAMQVINAVSFIAMSILNSMNPQLMKAEGAGDRNRMLMLTTKESKYALLTLSLFLLPLVFEMKGVLDFWLDEVPEYSVMFCRYMVVALIFDQITIGMTSANQAIGRIRNYTLLISTTRLMELLVGWMLLHLGMPPVSLMWAYLGMECVICFMRFIYLHKTASLNVEAYIKDVCIGSAVPLIGICVASYLVMLMPDFSLRFVITEIASVAVGCILIYYFSLSAEERYWTTEQINKLYAKVSGHN